MNMKRWQNQISCIMDFGSVAKDAQSQQRCIIPARTRLISVAPNVAWSDDTFVAEKVFIGTGPEKVETRTVGLGPFYDGVIHGVEPQPIDMDVPFCKYMQAFIVINDTLSVDKECRMTAFFEVASPCLVHLWEPFEIDPKDATQDWTTNVDGAGSLVLASALIDSGQDINIVSDADGNYTYMQRDIPTIKMDNASHWYVRCFVRIDKDASSVTTTTVSSTINGNSPIIGGAVNGTDYGMLLRLRGVQAATDEFYVDFNYPTKSGMGTISGITDLEDDRAYLIEGEIRAGVGGSQSAILRTYTYTGKNLNFETDTVEGTAENADTSGGKTLTSTGKWGDHDGSVGTCYVDINIDQSIILSKYAGVSP